MYAKARQICEVDVFLFDKLTSADDVGSVFTPFLTPTHDQTNVVQVIQLGGTACFSIICPFADLMSVILSCLGMLCAPLWCVVSSILQF